MFSSTTNRFFCLCISIGLVFSIFIFSIAFFLILSLIPLFIKNYSIQQSNPSNSIYRLDNLILPFENISLKNSKFLFRDLSMIRPTTTMIAQLENQFNDLFSKINANLIISEASLNIVQNQFIFNVQVNFIRPCLTCQSREKRLIKEIFESDAALSVDVQYRVNCFSSPIDLGMKRIRLKKTIYQISSLIQSSTLRYTDSCQLNQTTSSSTTYPLITDSQGCQKRPSSGLLLSINPISNETYSYYCFYFETSSSAKQITVSFTLSDNNPDLYIELDDITLNSTKANLILNGNFENINYTDQWNIQTCGSCDPGVDDLHPHSGDLGFYSSGVGVRLNQTIELSSINNQSNVYYISFWMAFECGGNNQCSIQANLLTI